MAGPATKGSYAERIARMRVEKDEAFRYEAGSPIDPHHRGEFRGLSYFPPDERWRVKARVTRLKDEGTFEMATSTGEPRRQLRFARLDFETPAGAASLYAYKDADGGHGHTLFVPLRDATSGKETYGAGRYLDVEEPPGGEVALDFNLAYNPYCAYSEAYCCPLPPGENWLKFPVTAGETAYADHP